MAEKRKTYTVVVETTGTWYTEHTVFAKDEEEAKKIAKAESSAWDWTKGIDAEMETSVVECAEQGKNDDSFYTPSEGVEHFGMFSDEGNLAVAAALAAALSDPTTTSVQTIQKAVIAQGFPEADDTVVREAIAAELASWLLQDER